MARPTLPQKDSKRGQALRKAEVAQKQVEYMWELHKQPYPYLAPGPGDELPFRENFNIKYQGQMLAKTERIAKNAIPGAIANPSARPGDVSGYRNYYPYFSIADGGKWLPKMRGVLTDDKWFAELRLAGANPMVIKRVTDVAHVTAASSIEDAHFEESFGPRATLAQAVAEGRLYACDYSALFGTKWGATNPSGQRFVAPCYALFYVDPDEGDGQRLMPGPIQPWRRKDKPNRIFTAREAVHYDWAAAKLTLQVADGVHHEMATHLARTHLVLEPFIIAAERNFSTKHPLLMLLRPHLRFVIGINHDARTRLLAEGGYVDRILGLRLQEGVKVAANAFSSFRFDTHAILPNELKDRGVGDPALLKHYPYRDDGLLLWSCIEELCTSYVDLYYKKDTDVSGDWELKAFVDEVTDPAVGQIQALNPADHNKINTKKDLARILTGIIWTSGPQHAAVNYPQWEIFGFIPNQPMAGYNKPPKIGAHWTAQDIVDFLPANAQVSDQIQLMHFLASQHYDELGEYLPGHFWDKPVIPIIDRFKQRLVDADAEIRNRNKARVYDYEMLLPRNVPNSTSV